MLGLVGAHESIFAKVGMAVLAPKTLRILFYRVLISGKKTLPGL
jgi:hypothetical protein